MRELRHAFVSGLLVRSIRDSVLPMTKTKSKITLKELREKWIEGGKKRAANLTAKRRLEISELANKALAEKRAAKQTPEPAAP